jgi:hypothetical protein
LRGLHPRLHAFIAGSRHLWPILLFSLISANKTGRRLIETAETLVFLGYTATPLAVSAGFPDFYLGDI